MGLAGAGGAAGGARGEAGVWGGRLCAKAVRSCGECGVGWNADCGGQGGCVGCGVHTGFLAVHCRIGLWQPHCNRVISPAKPCVANRSSAKSPSSQEDAEKALAFGLRCGLGDPGLLLDIAAEYRAAGQRRAEQRVLQVGRVEEGMGWVVGVGGAGAGDGSWG